MNATTHNTLNIIKSNISNSVVQITQSGKDAISKDTAQKLEKIIISEEIKGLPEEDRLDVRWLRLSEQNFRVDKWSLCRG